MNVSTTVPATVRIRRSRLLGLIGGVAALAATVTWAVTASAVDNGSYHAHSAPTQATVASLAIPPTGYLDTIRSANPARLGMIADPMTGYLKALTSMTPADANAAVLASLAPSERQHVQAITSMTPAQLKAAFGTSGR